MTDGFLCGWRVVSEIDLPELVSWTGDDRIPDVAVRVAATPRQLDDLVHHDQFIQVAQDGAILLTVDGIATCLVRSPSEVIVTPHPGSHSDEIKLLLLGSVLGFLCHLRGLFPLHGACVEIDGWGLVLAGPSGAGKSTLAAHLINHGCGLVADDVSAIEIIDGVPHVWPAFPRLKLCRDAVHLVDFAGMELGPTSLIRDKFHHVPRDRPFSTTPVPLRAIAFLEQPAIDETDWLVQIGSAPAIMAKLAAEVFRPTVAKALGRTRDLFVMQGAVARCVPVYQWRRKFDLTAMCMWTDRIKALATE